MGNFRSTGLTTLLLLIVSMVIMMCVASVITGETSGDSSTSTDYDQIVDDAVNEISTYIQIKDMKGKFYDISGTQKIKRIALLITPMVSQNIDFKQLTVQIDNGEMVNILYYQDSDKLKSSNLFGHSIWNSLNGFNYSLISINDFDDSIADFDIINENSDLAYLLIELPSNFCMQKYDTLKITLFPSTGITRTIILKAPMPMQSIVSFD